MYITTAFPYGNSELHAGHLSLALKGDAIAAIRTLVCGKPRPFYFSIHLTGLPVALRLQKLKQTPDEYPLFLENHIHRTPLSEPLNWYLAMKDYYTTLFKELNIRSQLGRGICHTTTEIDTGYSTFVRCIFKALSELGLLTEKAIANPFCVNCGVVLGDHERATFEGVGVQTCQVQVRNNRVCCKDCTCKEFTGNICKRVCRLMLQSSFGSANLAVATNRGQSIIHELGASLELDPCEQISFITTKLLCRCGGGVKVNYEPRQCIAFDNSEWLARTKNLIDHSIIDEHVKLVILNAIAKIRARPYSRTKGLGTTVDGNALADSLADSALHFLYYGVFESAKGSHSEVHLIGKDLLTNHVLYAYFFLDPQILSKISDNLREAGLSLDISSARPPYFKAYGHLKSADNQKMSKSKGNTVTWNNLRDKFNDTALRAYFYTRAEGLQDECLDNAMIEASYRGVVRSVRKTLKQIESLSKSECTQALRELERFGTSLRDVKNACKLRSVNEYLMNGFRLYVQSIHQTHCSTADASTLVQLYKTYVRCLYPVGLV